jgi:V8-like Glu-specific endopeptidase
MLIYRISAALWLSIVPLTSWPLAAAIFNHDDREYVSTEPGTPFAPVGLVTRGLLIQHYTTGTLIDACDVLTSQHILGTRPALGKRLKFAAAVGSRLQVSSAGTVIAAGGFDRTREIGDDWLLLRLDKCIGATLGYAKIRVAPANSPELSAIASAGYPMDRSRHRLTIDPSCRIRATSAEAWLNDCATLHGNSGGPLFRISFLDGRQQLEILAIQAAGYIEPHAIPFSRGWENRATPASTIVPRISAFLTAPAVHGANPMPGHGMN